MAPAVARALGELRDGRAATDAGQLVFPGPGGGYLDASALLRRYKAALARAGLNRLRLPRSPARLPHGHDPARRRRPCAYAPRPDDACNVAEGQCGPHRVEVEAPLGRSNLFRQTSVAEAISISGHRATNP
jgi:hypothetical protein